MKLTCERCGSAGAFGYLKPREHLVDVACAEHREAYHEPIEMPDGTVAVAAMVAWLRTRAKGVSGEPAQDSDGALALNSAADAIERRDW